VQCSSRTQNTGVDSRQAYEKFRSIYVRANGNNSANGKLDRPGGAVSAASGTLAAPQESSVKRGTGRSLS
jgi:hypothetical protein